MPLHHAVNHGIMIIEGWLSLAMGWKDFPNSHVWDCWYLLCVMWFNSCQLSLENLHWCTQQPNTTSLPATLWSVPTLYSYVEWKDWNHRLDPNHPPMLLIQTYKVHYFGNRKSNVVCVCACTNMRFLTAPFQLSQSSRTLQKSFKTVLPCAWRQSMEHSRPSQPNVL